MESLSLLKNSLKGIQKTVVTIITVDIDLTISDSAFVDILIFDIELI